MVVVEGDSLDNWIVQHAFAWLLEPHKFLLFVAKR